ncbi:MAG: hypothetical protein JNL70_26855 [Saprospiraceae bacterium]|nr:hypothetical protein [Saprospiraceae bacterium]
MSEYEAASRTEGWLFFKKPKGIYLCNVGKTLKGFSNVSQILPPDCLGTGQYFLNAHIILIN